MNPTELVLGSVILEPHTRAQELAAFTDQAQIAHWRRRATEAEELLTQLVDGLHLVLDSRSLNEAKWLAQAAMPFPPQDRMLTSRVDWLNGGTDA